MTAVCGSRFTFKLDMRAVMLAAVWHTTADRTGLTLCTLQTEGEKKVRKRKKRRSVIRRIAFIITGGNRKFTSDSVPRQCLLLCPVKLGLELTFTGQKNGNCL